jgi:excisionase family DNA binding protein
MSTEKHNDELTTAEAATTLAVKPRAIARYCQRGKIPGAKLRFGRWYVPRSSVEAMLAR